MLLMTYLIPVRDEEIARAKFDLIDHLYKRMEAEFNRRAPHGPVERYHSYDKVFKMHTIEVVAEWKEPVQ